MSDRQLRQHVLDELEFEPSVDAAGIRVTAEHGVVTLAGHVPDCSQRRAAERAAWRVKGVKDIAQEIEVRLPSHIRCSDEEIALRVIIILAWNASIPNRAIKARVDDGWITLTGQVDWNYQRDAAEREVRNLSGVNGVTNRIELKPSAKAENVKQRIVDALHRHAEVEAGRIRVEIQDSGTVMLEGEVDNWDERRAVEHAVWSTPGVRAVVDRLRIL